MLILSIAHALEADGKDGLWLATGDGLQHVDTKSGVFKVWHHTAVQPGR